MRPNFLHSSNDIRSGFCASVLIAMTIPALAMAQSAPSPSQPVPSKSPAANSGASSVAELVVTAEYKRKNYRTSRSASLRSTAKRWKTKALSSFRII